MKFLLDHNLPPSWARGLREISDNKFADGHCTEVVALKERFKSNTPDTEWLGVLGGEGSWAVLTADHFRSKGNAEREVIRRSGLSVFVLTKSWNSQQFWPRTAQLFHWWPRIVDQSNAVKAAALEVPWRSTSKFVYIKL